MTDVLPMPDVRRQRLKQLEEVIASGWAEVVRIGMALWEIRDEGLYLELGEGLTFENYCKSRWALPKATAYQYIDAAQIEQATSAIADAVPITMESTARELAPLLRTGGPAKVAEAWSKISERFRGQRPPTAKEVHKVLIEEGFKKGDFGGAGGKPNTLVLLGQFGDKLLAAQKRLDWFYNHDIAGRSVGKNTQQRALEYAERCEAMAASLRKFGGEE